MTCSSYLEDIPLSTESRNNSKLAGVVWRDQLWRPRPWTWVREEGDMGWGMTVAVEKGGECPQHCLTHAPKCL